MGFILLLETPSQKYKTRVGCITFYNNNFAALWDHYKVFRLSKNDFLGNFSFIVNRKWNSHHFSTVKKPFWGPNWSSRLEQVFLKNGSQQWTTEMLTFGKWINNFYWWDVIKIIISVSKEKVQFTLTFYLKQSKEVPLDLKCFEIFTFLSLFPSLPPGEMREETSTYGFLRFKKCVFNKEIFPFFENFCD